MAEEADNFVAGMGRSMAVEADEGEVLHLLLVPEEVVDAARKQQDHIHNSGIYSVWVR